MTHILTRDSHHCVLDGLAKERLGGLLHLGEDHGADLLSLVLLVVHNHDRLLVLVDHLEGEQLDVLLNGGIIEPAVTTGAD